jgi:hypothetical protein
MAAQLVAFKRQLDAARRAHESIGSMQQARDRVPRSDDEAPMAFVMRGRRIPVFRRDFEPAAHGQSGNIVGATRLRT